MKLQKLVFFLHGWGLALQDRAIINEQVEAWPYGPVVDSLYHELKHHGSKPVTDYLTEINQTTGKLVALVPSLKDEAFWSLLEKVWERYAGYSAMELSSLTHRPGSPWEKSRKTGARTIPEEEISGYFKERLQSQHA